MGIAIILVGTAIVVVAASYGLWYLAKNPKSRSGTSESAGPDGTLPPTGLNV
jgi:hypothetical protein